MIFSGLARGALFFEQIFANGIPADLAGINNANFPVRFSPLRLFIITRGSEFFVYVHIICVHALATLIEPLKNFIGRVMFISKKDRPADW